MIKRLTVNIWLLLKENPVLPLSFKYNNKCLLEQLKKERDIYKQRQKEKGIVEKSLMHNADLYENEGVSPGISGAPDDIHSVMNFH